MNRFYVYIHRRKDNGEIFYVGKGKNNRLLSTSGRNKYWIFTATKCGCIAEILFDNLSEKDSFQIEKDVILELKYFGATLTNLTNGGEGLSGFKQSDSHINKLVQSRKNSYLWKLGISRMKEKLTGRKLPEDVKEKISKSNTGKTRSNETKAKLSISKKSCPKAINHILSLSKNRRDKSVYKFYKLTGDIFYGTRFEFVNYSKLCAKEVNKLFQTKSRRTSVKEWRVDLSEILKENK